MNYNHLLASLAESSNDPWCLIQYPGPQMRICSLGLQQALTDTRDAAGHSLTEKMLAKTLIRAFEGAPRLQSPGENTPLQTPVGCFDHVKAVPVNEAGEDAAFLLYFIQSAPGKNAITPAKDAIEALSARQTDVLEGVYSGETNKSIAVRMGISEKTVEKHRAKVMERLEVTSVAELVRLVTVLKLETSGNQVKACAGAKSYPTLAANQDDAWTDRHA